MAFISLTGVKSVRPAENGNVDVVFATRYTGDYPITLTRACRDELIAALAGASPPAIANLTAEPPVVASKPASAIAAAAGDQMAAGGQLKVSVPKKWVVAADLKVRDLVIVLFDPQTATQSGYALSPDAANRMAGALVQNAKAVLENVDKKHSNGQTK